MKKILKEYWKTLIGKLSVLFFVVAFVMTIQLIKYSHLMELAAIPFLFMTLVFYAIAIVGFVWGILHTVTELNSKKHKRLSKFITISSWCCAACILCTPAGPLGALPFFFWFNAFVLANTNVLKNILYYGGILLVARNYFWNWFYFRRLPHPLDGGLILGLWITILLIVTICKLYKYYKRSN